jgi:uncharacterized protein (DUF488 family)
MTLYTIGYEGMEVEHFLAAVHLHGIQTVVDVRELPLSRKPGFSKKALSAHLMHAGLQYSHLPALGCPRAIRHRYRADGDWARYETAFLAHLKVQGSALAALSSKVSESPSALLCFEADAQHCHRTMVAAAIAQLQAMPIVHIKGSARLHRSSQLAAAAR